jgi:membrane protease YdiL (CAAX protease family)
MGQSVLPKGGPSLADESGSGPNTGPETKPAPVVESEQLDATLSSQPRPWGRADRNRLLIWVAIGFLLPVPFMLALHHSIKPTGSVFSVRSELPTKAILAFFVVLATWVVSRLERRPLDDYGIPLRQAFGKRFWEGAIWGFAGLSAILLILRVSGHFRIESSALTGSAILRCALGWGAVFLAVSINEELAFRGYWLFSFSRRLGFWRTALFTSIMFGVAHLGNPGENVLGPATEHIH